MKSISLIRFIVPVLGLIVLGGAQSAFAQNTINVPENFPTIAQAVSAANPGDIIRVSPGNWCGAVINKPINLFGEGNATIVACPGIGSALKPNGFFIRPNVSNISIRGFVFDGRGFSDTNRNALAVHIMARPGVNNVIVEHNTFLGGIGGVNMLGSGWNVSHNVFDGIGMLNSCDGAYAILAGTTGSQRSVGNVFTNNQISGFIQNVNVSQCSWINEADVAFGGIILIGQQGAVASNNRFSIPTNSFGDAGAGILVTDQFSDFAQLNTSANLQITNNDGRGSQYSLIITKDHLTNGNANTENALIRGNFGNNSINDVTANIRNRSVRTLLDCDENGDCQ